MKIDVYINSDPITNDFDLWRTIDAAEISMKEVISETSRKDIREAQQKASKAIFENMKTLIMDYMKNHTGREKE